MELLILLATNSDSTILLRRSEIGKIRRSEIGKILNFYSASRQGGGQSRRPSIRGRSLSVPLAAPTLYRRVVGGSNCRGNIHQPSPPPIELTNVSCTWSKDARIELGQYLNMFRRYATPEIKIHVLRTRLHFASFSSRR